MIQHGAFFVKIKDRMNFCRLDLFFQKDFLTDALLPVLYLFFRTIDPQQSICQ